jgi:hypothetical protein
MVIAVGVDFRRLARATVGEGSALVATALRLVTSWREAAAYRMQRAESG